MWSAVLCLKPKWGVSIKSIENYKIPPRQRVVNDDLLLITGVCAPYIVIPLPKITYFSSLQSFHEPTLDIHLFWQRDQHHQTLHLPSHLENWLQTQQPICNKWGRKYQSNTYLYWVKPCRPAVSRLAVRNPICYNICFKPPGRKIKLEMHSTCRKTD